MGWRFLSISSAPWRRYQRLVKSHWEPTAACCFVLIEGRLTCQPRLGAVWIGADRLGIEHVKRLRDWTGELWAEFGGGELAVWRAGKWRITDQPPPWQTLQCGRVVLRVQPTGIQIDDTPYSRSNDAWGIGARPIEGIIDLGASEDGSSAWLCSRLHGLFKLRIGLPAQHRASRAASRSRSMNARSPYLRCQGMQRSFDCQCTLGALPASPLPARQLRGDAPVECTPTNAIAVLRPADLLREKDPALGLRMD
jgi:hypothetical protein